MARICRLSRPAVKPVFEQFPQRHAHIFGRLRKQGYAVEELSITPYRTPSLYLSYTLGMLRAAVRFVRSRPDVVIAEDTECAFFALLMRRCVPFRFIFDFIDDYALIVGRQGHGLRYRLARYTEKAAPRRADRVIVVDTRKLEYCLSIGVPRERIALVSNGYEAGRFRPAPPDGDLAHKLGINSGAIVTFVGKLNAYYNIETVIDAIPGVIASVPETTFVFVGDGYAADALKRRCARLDMARHVCFTGPMPYDDIPALINLADLCVFSLPDESALVLLEYAACGKPIIVPAGGTARMGISKGVFPDDCMLHVPDTPQGFAAGIVKLLENRAVAAEMGARARERVADACSWDAVSARYREAIDTVTDTL